MAGRRPLLACTRTLSLSPLSPWCLVYNHSSEACAPVRQGVAIAILVYAGVIRKESWTTYDKLNVASGIQARAGRCVSRVLAVGVYPAVDKQSLLSPARLLAGLPDLHRNVPRSPRARLRLPAAGAAPASDARL
jgi:hypothetical protein